LPGAVVACPCTVPLFGCMKLHSKRMCGDCVNAGSSVYGWDARALGPKLINPGCNGGCLLGGRGDGQGQRMGMLFGGTGAWR
jgi:hypothetical protein